jgi:hypothetical protein
MYSLVHWDTITRENPKPLTVSSGEIRIASFGTDWFLDNKVTGKNPSLVKPYFHVSRILETSK